MDQTNFIYNISFKNHYHMIMLYFNISINLKRYIHLNLQIFTY